jgi:hypothetical protein
MTNIQYLSLSWILMFLVQELLYLVHACSSCPTLFPDAVVTGICLLILRCFFSGCTRLARLNAAHLLRPKGTLGKKQGNHSFKSYKVARCPQAPSFPWARARASAGALAARARAARAARAANLRFKVVLYRP